MPPGWFVVPVLRTMNLAAAQARLHSTATGDNELVLREYEPLSKRLVGFWSDNVIQTSL